MFQVKHQFIARCCKSSSNVIWWSGTRFNLFKDMRYLRLRYFYNMIDWKHCLYQQHIRFISNNIVWFTHTSYHFYIFVLFLLIKFRLILSLCTRMVHHVLSTILDILSILRGELLNPLLTYRDILLWIPWKW